MSARLRPLGVLLVSAFAVACATPPTADQTSTSERSVAPASVSPSAAAGSTPPATPTGPARLDLDVLGPNGNDANDAKPGDALPIVAVPHNSVYEIACRSVTWSVSPPAAGTLDDLGRPGAGVLFRAAPLPPGTPSVFGFS